MTTCAGKAPRQEAVDDRVDLHGSGKEVDVAHGHGRVWPALLHLNMQALMQHRRHLPTTHIHHVTCSTEK